jgi:O-antigen/teichoic acid export membrane protein
MINFSHIKFNKDIFLISTGNIFRIFLVIGYSRLMTFYLNYEQLSKYYIVFSIYTFFSFIIIGSIGHYINRKTIEWINDNSLKDGLIKLFINLLIPITLFAFISVFIYTYLVYDSVSYSLIICLLICSLIIFKTSSESIYPIFNIINLNSKYIFFLLLFNLLNLILSTFFVYIFDFTFQYWMLGLVSSNILIAFISWRSLLDNFNLTRSSSINYQEIFSFSSNILIGHVLIWFLTDGFRLIAEQKFTTENLGILILGLVVSTQIFGIIESILNQLLYPNYLKNISDVNFEKRSEAFNDYLSKVLPIILFIAIFITLYSSEVLFVLIDSSKINSNLINIFQIGLWIEFFRVLINTLKHITTSEYKTSRIILPYLVGTIVFLTGAFSMKLNVIQFSSLLLLSYSFIAIFSIISFNKIIKIKVNYLLFIKLVIYVLPLFFVLIFIKNTFTFILGGLYLLLVLYQLINKGFHNEIN